MKKVFLLFGFLMLFRCSPDSVEAFSETLTVSVIDPPFSQATAFISKGGYNVSFRLVCVTASSDTVIDKLFSEGFNLGESPNQFRKRIGDKMQNEIDAYQERHTVFTSAAFSASAALIEAGLDGGI